MTSGISGLGVDDPGAGAGIVEAVVVVTVVVRDEGLMDRFAMYHLYMSLAPRLVVFVSELRRVVTKAESVGKAARSSTINAGCDEMVPRIDIRRPF